MQSNDPSVISGLMRVLADTFALYRKTHGYHWNVTGANFSSLHKLFNDQYDELWESVDVIAEHIRAMKSLVPQDFAGMTSIRPGDESTPWRAMVAELAAGHQQLIELLEGVQAAAEDVDDQSTLNLIADRLNAHQKHLWMLTATLEP